MATHPVVLVLLTLLKVALLSGHRDLGYGLERFDASTGIYYESLGKGTLYNTDWNAIVYLPLRPITRQIIMTENYADYIQCLCSRVYIRNWTAYSHLDDSTSTRFRQVKDVELVCGNMRTTRHVQPLRLDVSSSTNSSTTYQSLQIQLVQNAPDDGPMRSETCRANISVE